MTSNVNNSGIAHFAFRAGGQPFCKSRRAHFSVTTDNQAGYQICKRCQAKAESMRAAKRRADERNEAEEEIIWNNSRFGGSGMTRRAHEPNATPLICIAITLAIITIVFHAAMKMGGVL